MRFNLFVTALDQMLLWKHWLLRAIRNVHPFFSRYCMSAGPAGARALGGALAGNSSLTFLALTSCKLRAQGAIDLAGGAQQNRSLAVLLLCKNNIGDKGACALADFVAGSGLQRLALSSNNIKHTGALALAKACSRCKVRSRHVLAAIEVTLLSTACAWGSLVPVRSNTAAMCRVCVTWTSSRTSLAVKRLRRC